MAKEKTPEQKALHAERERQRRAANREEYNAKARSRREEKGEHIRALDRARYENDPRVREQKIENAKRQARKDPEATREYLKKYREVPGNRERLLEYARLYRLDPEKRPGVLAASRERHYASSYGISTTERDAMLAAQNGKCAICQKETSFRSGGAGVDHCHTTGKLRAVLCGSCNPGLGKFFDSPELLEAAALYIRSHRG